MYIATVLRAGYEKERGKKSIYWFKNLALNVSQMLQGPTINRALESKRSYTESMRNFYLFFFFSCPAEEGEKIGTQLNCQLLLPNI